MKTSASGLFLRIHSTILSLSALEAIQGQVCDTDGTASAQMRNASGINLILDADHVAIFQLKLYFTEFPGFAFSRCAPFAPGPDERPITSLEPYADVRVRWDFPSGFIGITLKDFAHMLLGILTGRLHSRNARNISSDTNQVKKIEKIFSTLRVRVERFLDDPGGITLLL